MFVPVKCTCPLSYLYTCMYSPVFDVTLLLSIMYQVSINFRCSFVSASVDCVDALLFVFRPHQTRPSPRVPPPRHPTHNELNNFVDTAPTDRYLKPDINNYYIPLSATINSRADTESIKHNNGVITCPTRRFGFCGNPLGHRYNVSLNGR